MPYLYLTFAILAETIGTTALQASNQFSKLWPSIIVVISYAVAFYLLSLSLRFFPVGIAYAIWSGLGIVFIALIGLVIFGQTLDWPAILGMLLIIARNCCHKPVFKGRDSLEAGLFLQLQLTRPQHQKKASPKWIFAISRSSRTSTMAKPLLWMSC